MIDSTEELSDKEKSKKQLKLPSDWKFMYNNLQVKSLYDIQLEEEKKSVPAILNLPVNYKPLKIIYKANAILPALT